MIFIYPGQGKTGIQEKFFPIQLETGKIYGVVGPTGSGKTQLLEDIERLSPGDGVTKRRVICQRPIQIHHLSQKMNYMVDMPIRDFITLYMESLGYENPDAQAQCILKTANELSGEGFSEQKGLTELSGGQSRALMIATVALDEKADVVLLDEIENAGINRVKALELLTMKNKIVLLITHDPLLALLADCRLILKQGAIVDVLNRTETEKKLTENLFTMDDYLNKLRDKIRSGQNVV